MSSVYLLFQVNVTTTERELIGVYSDKDLAEAEALNRSKLSDDENILYDITPQIDVDVDLSSQDLNKRMEDEIQEDLIALMNEGLIDQLVDENGNFVYTLTSEGLENANQLLSEGE